MEAQDFWNRFSECLVEKQGKAENAWKYNKDYTEFIIGMMEEIIGKEGAGFETSKEYYRIDLTGWSQLREKIKADIPSNGNYDFQPYLWDLEVAIEHENNDKLWMDEVIKLSHIVCKLRVVIGYMPIELKDTQMDYLNYVSNAINNNLKVRGNMNNDFLIILGDSKLKKGDKKCNYTPYIWKNNKFVPLLSKEN